MTRPAVIPKSRTYRLGDVLRRHNEIIHPGDREDGEAVFVGLEHIESQTGRRIGSATIDLRRLTGRKPTFRAGQIVYGYLRPYLNKVWVAEFDGCSSVDQFAFEVRSDIVDARYIAAFMRSETFLRRAAVVTTTGQLPRISIEEIEAVEVELPPLAEQERIAAELTAAMSAVDRARRAAEERLTAAEALPAAYLREVFEGPGASEWEARPLRDVAEIVSGITLGRRFLNGATRRVPYLRVANVKDGYLDLNDVYEIEATQAEVDELTLRRGDLLLTEGGDRDKLGRGTFWEEQLPLCLHQNHIFRVRLTQSHCPRFAALQLGSSYGKSYFLRHAKQTTGIATINRAVLGSFPLLAPPLPEQHRIAADLGGRLEAAEALIARCREELAAVEALPAALLREAFGDAGTSTTI